MRLLSFKKLFDLNRLFDSSLSIKYRIMSIVAYSAAVGNTIGFLANFFLYGMSFPTAFCGICALLAVFYLLFGIHSKYYMFTGCILVCVLFFFEFPLLVFAYGSVMCPYLVLGFMAAIMLTSGKRRLFTGIGLGIYYIAVIVLSQLFPFIFGEQEVSGLLGSAIITFAVAIISLTFCTIAWQNVYLRDSIETDGITGVLSRVGFLRKAGKIIKNSADGRYSVLCFDVRSFKAINTVYGTEVGNEILSVLADYIKEAFFLPVLTGRFGADRFICLVDSSKINFEILRDFCSYTYIYGDNSINVSLSCGIYPVTNPEEDIQLICDKSASIIHFIRVGQNKCFAVFNEEMEISFYEETRILEDVERAIRNENFEPYYQPIVDCKTGKIVSAEALARWIHPEKGVIGPGTFIPILEKKEMISNLDYIIISKVDELMKKCKNVGLPIVPISANLSRVDLFNSTLIEKIHNIISNDGLTGGLSRFEVTESALISLPNNVFDILSELRSNGASFLVDDFGSGYSSLGMISSFDFDIIKLDKQFSDQIETSEKNRGVIKSIIELAHNLNSKIIAEGVENETQYNFLKECGCDFVQGFYFYRPMSEKDFINILKEQETEKEALKA